MSGQLQSIPVEGGWPLLGILPNLFNQDPYAYLKNVMLQKGDFVQLNIGPQAVYLVSRPEYLQRILRDNYQNYRKPEMFYATAKDIAQNGLLLSSGDLWLRQRRMIQPYLHRKVFGELFEDMTDAIAEALKEWEILAKNGTEFELGEKIGDVTINVITRTMFGKNTLDPQRVTEIGYCAMRMIRYVGATLYSIVLPKWFPIPGKRQFQRDLQVIKEAVGQIVEASRNNKETSASLIQMLINAVDEETHEQMTEQQLLDEVMTIFIAGYETTATALTWLGVVAQQQPQVIQKLCAEIDEVLGDRLPSFQDVPRLSYTKQVFMEIMRMYTVAPFLPRALNTTDQLGTYNLPANALVLMFYHGVHHNPSVWDDPESFNPDRFTPERMSAQHPFAYLPFSAGPRKCAGDEFALLEGTLVISMMLQKYNLHIRANQKFTSGLSVTNRPKGGVKSTISLRHPS